MPVHLRALTVSSSDLSMTRVNDAFPAVHAWHMEFMRAKTVKDFGIVTPCNRTNGRPRRPLSTFDRFEIWKMKTDSSLASMVHVYPKTRQVSFNGVSASRVRGKHCFDQHVCANTISRPTFSHPELSSWYELIAYPRQEERKRTEFGVNHSRPLLAMYCITSSCNTPEYWRRVLLFPGPTVHTECMGSVKAEMI